MRLLCSGGPDQTNRLNSLRATAGLAAIGLIVIAISGALTDDAFGSTTTHGDPSPASQAATHDPPPTDVTTRSPDEVYGLWVILPAVVAIALAILLRQVLPALAIGVFVAAMMYLPWSHPVAQGQFAYNPITGLIVAVETHLIGTLQDVEHLQIILFTLLIGAVVEVISANGGTGAMVDLISRWASNRRRGQVTGWFAGLAIFFGDYPNMLIVGPTMRPMFDRLRISRAKLAYIVDSTAAPVASLALIGEWVAVQVGYIQDGLATATASDAGKWVQDLGAFEVFVASLPYRFYSIFALALVLIIGLLGRDFGPMLRAERRAASTPPNESHADPQRDALPTPPATSCWFAVGPILLLIVATLALLLLTGWYNLPNGEPVSIQTLLANAETARTMMYASLLSLVMAIGVSLGWRRLDLAQSMDAVMVGFNRMLIAAVILSLAWALSDAMRALNLAQVATVHLRGAGVGPEILPVLVFLAASGVSFATGTSWGTMGILMPVTVAVAADLASGLPIDAARPGLYAAVAAVMAGAVFGDHCSPISDTTVLSAAATQCTIESHVWTQMPYALLTAAVAVLAGNVLCNYAGLSSPLCLATGVVVLVGIIRCVGRPVVES